MVKQITFAVAGSGKTSSIIDRLNEDSRCLIITYTDNNTRHLTNKIINKFSCIPKGIRVYSYFTFIYSFCYRPLFGVELPAKGLNFTRNLPKDAQFAPTRSKKHFFDENGRLYANRIAKLLLKIDKKLEVIGRIDHFFDFMCVDEVQDFAANDFSFLCSLINAKAELLLVGDFYQHTFDTSRDGNINQSLHKNYEKYCGILERVGFDIDFKSLTRSYRCSPSICSFVKQNLGINIESHRIDEVEVRLIRDRGEVESIVNDSSVIKLFYQNARTYRGNTDNWGNTKGLDDFLDVCVVLNDRSFKAFTSNALADLPSTTKNKLYVACTRARRNLYFISEASIKPHKKVE